MKNNIKLTPHKTMKSVYQIMDFIFAIKSGKKSIIIGNDYVVISRKHYDELVERKQNLCKTFP